MLKKIFLLFFIFNLPFLTPVLAQTPTPEETETTATGDEKEPWYSFFTKLFGSDSSQGTQVKTGASWNYAKEKPDNGNGQAGQLLDTSKNREYNSQGFDTTTRAITDQTQKIEKGKYLYHLLNDDDSYQNLEYQSTGCNKISLKKMAAAYYQRGEKILYDENNQQLDWDKDIMDEIEVKDPENICYTTVYDQMPMAPQGTFRKSFLDNITGKDTKIAAASSGQINNTFRTIIPASNQTDNITPDINDPTKSASVVEDSHTQEGNMLLNMIPASAQYLTNSATDRENLRNTYTLWLHPDSWEDDSPERDENTPILDIDISLEGSRSCSSSGYCNGKKSHCRGMSQYGAYGMAKSGKTYEEILKFYYGDIAFTKIDTDSEIKVKIDRADSKCSSGQTIGINLEEYLSALGEMSDEWGKKGMEALKAQVIAARTYAYTKTKGLTTPICNTANCQVFRCSDIGERPNLLQAVKATTGIIIVDANTQKLFPTEYARSFCGSSLQVTCDNHTIPSVNAAENIKYEKLGHPSNLYCKSYGFESQSQSTY